MKNDPTKTAIHEAGHAVACCRFMPSRYVNMVTIIPDHEEGYEGAHAPAESWDFDANAALNDVLYICSGYAACVAAGIESTLAAEGCDSDFDYAKQIIENWRLAPLEEHLSKAISLMQQPENLRAVRLIATELMEYRLLFSDEIEALIEVADANATEEDLARFRILSNAKERRAAAILLTETSSTFPRRRLES